MSERKNVQDVSCRELMDLANLANLAEDKYIAEAAELDGEKCGREPEKQLKWKMWAAAAAACLCLIAAGGMLGGNLFQDGPTQGGADGPVQGIWIPAVQLPDSTSGETYDMVACVVYKGNIYMAVGDSSHYGNDAERVRGLLDEYVGEAKGNLDEWSTQSDYAEELAGSVSGPVYTVKGYDPCFRLAVSGPEDILILEHLNGIRIEKGSEIFEDYLHLSENWRSVSCIDHETWYYAEGGEESSIPVSFDDSVWGRFLTEISQGNFEDLQRTDIYDRIALHLYVTMKDGTINHLRISSDGYVLYDGLGWYGVKISEDTLQEVLDACGIAS